MELVRILHPDEYEPAKRRFKGSAFEPYVDLDDISVFEENCAVGASLTICRHVDIFYPETVPPATPPSAFYLWKFSKAALPPGCNVTQKNSESGDVCHYNISGLTKKAAMKWFKKAHVDSALGSFLGVWKCDGSGLSLVTGPEFI